MIVKQAVPIAKNIARKKSVVGGVLASPLADYAVLPAISSVNSGWAAFNIVE
jgi:hypothetical protein